MLQPDEPETIIVPASDALLGDPPRTEHVNVFAIARAPVTNAEYVRYLRDDRGASDTATDGAPVSGVSWADAVGYCRWLTKATSHIWRLPDEREWEKASRAGLLAHPASGALEWTNSYDQGRVVKRLGQPEAHLRDDGKAAVGFRVVRGMTGR